MSRVTQMETDGLVVRRPHPEDGRAILLEATPKGADLKEHGRRLRIASLAAQLEHLTVEELDILEAAVALLERMLLRQA